MLTGMEWRKAGVFEKMWVAAGPTAIIPPKVS
jgi:hypothetical protein